MTAKEKEMYELANANEIQQDQSRSLTQHQQQFVNLLRSINVTRVVFHQENDSEVSVNMNNDDITGDEDYVSCSPGSMDICSCLPTQEYSVGNPNTIASANTTYVAKCSYC